MSKHDEYIETDFDSVKIRLASPDRIRQWGERILPNGEIVGKITNPETINYRTLKPEMDGLFCERTFGPVKDWECHCGKYKRVKYSGVVCDRCGVEVTESRVRRYNKGYIELAGVVTHIWYSTSRPSYLSLLLNISPSELEQIIYFHAYAILNQGEEDDIEIISIDGDDEWDLISRGNIIYRRAKLSKIKSQKLRSKKKKKTTLKLQRFEIGIDIETGALALRNFLQNLDIAREMRKVENKIELLKSSFDEDDPKKNSKALIALIRRYRIIQYFAFTKAKPEWMILSVIPVIPPDLRPMVQLDGGRYAFSDLNDLYRGVLYRNNRLVLLQEAPAPEMVIRNEKRMLQEAVDALIDNGRRGRMVVGSNNKPLKSLSDILKGKEGRFRQNLLGKRVDYSGRSVIVVGPRLKLYQCGLPREMAIELFQPFVIHRLIDQGLAYNANAAKRLIYSNDPIIKEVLEEVIRNHPILLNRAPTLHRLSIQAFEPKLVEERAIQLHPLVCTAFNADFDGDQMAVHIPLSLEAQAEARLLMLSTHNILSPATGDPIITPGQDIVLGCYYLTVENPKSFNNNLYFKNFEDVLMAYEQSQINLHSYVWVQFNENVDDPNSQNYYEMELLELQIDSLGSITKIYQNRRIKQDINGKVIAQYIYTTPGRVLFNKAIQNSLCN
uniref:DNA-directed RNA polymerase subunit gamma n=1 Tax=Glaucocystis incrassata TaxID=1789788 RepID=A0A3G1IVM5_9EUKA|nr:RNA polymerase beta' subunit [Glaucocystis incrassata]ASQ40081.1 RNA polymerase beta' subunit [Glaucocystis incrassata]